MDVGSGNELVLQTVAGIQEFQNVLMPLGVAIMNPPFRHTEGPPGDQPKRGLKAELL